MKRSAPLAAVVGLTLALSVTGCTDPSVSATMKSIDSIGTVSIESKDAIDSANKQYDSLDKELKKEVENYDERRAQTNVTTNFSIAKSPRKSAILKKF